jgi:hypothetical protein
MQLLSRRKDKFRVGATKKEILHALNLKNRNKFVFFYRLITQLSQYIEPLGLQIRFNSIDSHWFLSYDSDLSDLNSANPFEGKPKLAATMFCVLLCCVKNSGKGKIHEIKELRKKKKVTEDLRELEELGYISVDMELKQITLTPLIGYHLDTEKLFRHFALKVKEKEVKMN